MNTGSNPLADLIDRAEEANRWSDVDVARRASAAGFPISKSHISGMRREPLKSIAAGRMNALAAGLGVPLAEVIRVSLQTLGLPAPDAYASPEHAIQSDSSLSSQTKSILLATLKAARQTQGDENEDTSTQSAPRSPSTDGKAGTRGAPMNPSDPITATRHAPRSHRNADPIGQPATLDHQTEPESTRTSSTVRPLRD